MPCESRAETLLAHPRFEAVIQAQARRLLDAHAAEPRLAAPFATQQRWLMGHAGLACYFRGLTGQSPDGVAYGAFLDAVQKHALASRNTAAAFFNEALKYGIVRAAAADGVAQPRVVVPAEGAVRLLMHWHLLHLSTLDALDGNSRSQRFAAEGFAGLARMQPLVADGLLASPAVRDPGPTYSLFTWADEGGVLMERMIVGMAGLDPVERMPTDITSVTALASNLALSRTHTGRKIAAAEALGSLGWMGRRGRSPLWISLGFRREYAQAQAAKLAIVDTAFAKAGFAAASQVFA
ncbi:MAG TPA: hypothetical protein VD995_15570 [Azospirillum sp.]|nr:hypothetical protein [Azospirillum sp.]